MVACGDVKKVNGGGRGEVNSGGRGEGRADGNCWGEMSKQVLTLQKDKLSDSNASTVPNDV